MRATEVDVHEESNSKKGYEPSRALFFVMLGLMVAALVVFIVVGPLKGGGRAGTNKSTSTPSTQHKPG